MDRGQRITELARRRRIERVLFRLDRTAHSGKRPAAEALRNEAARSAFAGRREEIVDPVGPEPVGRGEAAVEMGEIARVADCGHLVNDDLGPGVEQGRAHGREVEGVDDGRRGARPTQRLDFRRRPREPCDRMPRGDEPRHKTPSDRARGACNEDAHRLSPLSSQPACRSSAARRPSLIQASNCALSWLANRCPGRRLRSAPGRRAARYPTSRFHGGARPPTEDDVENAIERATVSAKRIEIVLSESIVAEGQDQVY